MFKNSILGIVIALIALVINLIYWNVYYYSRLTKIYDVVIDGSDASFNAVFGKAWFLHSFVD